jgi:UDP-2,3-diacylglucosamine pyrophosphatase LpxH
MSNSLPNTPPLVSFYSDYANVTEQHRRPITDILAEIKGGTYREVIESIRRIPYGTPAYKEAKRNAKVPGFTTCGAFTRRCAQGLEMPSGLIAMDLDQSGNGGENLDQIAKRLQLDSYVYSVFKSVSGLGYAVIFCIPPTTNKEDFLGSWRALAAYLQDQYGVKADEACKNMDRLRFVSHDPELFVNEAADVFEEVKAEPVKARRMVAPVARYVGSGKSFGQYMLDKAVNEIHHAPDGGRHEVRRRVSFMLGGLVATGHLDHDTAAGQLYGAFLAAGDGSGQDAGRKTIEGQLREGARSPWLPTEQERVVYQRRNDGRERNEIKALLSLDKPEFAEAIGKAVDKLLDEPEAEILTFWRLESTRSGNVLKLAKTKFRDWLIEQGFYKKPVGTSVEFLRVTGPCVRVVTQSEVIDHVTDYIESLPERFDGVSREQLSDLVLGKIRDTFDAVFMAALPVLPKPFVRDTEDTMYCFFANCYTATTAEATMAHDYGTMPGYIWEAQRKPYDFSLVSDGGEFCDYDMFTRNIMAQDPQRLLSLQCAMGYLMHGFKVQKNNRARVVIFYDQFGKTGVENGGTGKGLLMKALENVVMTSKLEGETFDFGDAFKYATIKEGSRVTYFDEWRKDLNFKSLFSEVTGSITINRKHQQQLVWDFEDSPKFAITTNNMVMGEGGSHERRKIEIALCGHYHKDHSPTNDVTNGFFSEGNWGEFEWNQFYNLALGWVQKYLVHGHVTAEVAEGAKRKLMDRTSDKFIEFAEELVAEVGTNDEESLWTKHAVNPSKVLSVVWARDAYQAFDAQHEGAVKTQNQFNDWMGVYGFEKAKCNSRRDRKNQMYFAWPEAA